MREVKRRERKRGILKKLYNYSDLGIWIVEVSFFLFSGAWSVGDGKGGIIRTIRS